MSLLASSPWPRSLPAMLAAVLLSGCTMCPDPFDYSGPVPNGTPPQNDFRARSNGILPLSAAPVPWPPLVDADADPGVRRAGGRGPEADKAAVAQTGFVGAKQAAGASNPPDEPPTDVSPPLADGTDAAATSAPADEAWSDLEPTGAEPEPETPPQPVAIPAAASPLTETPGWRARR